MILGNPCGMGINEGYPYIYFVDPKSNQFNRTVCLASCPTQDSAITKCKPNVIVTSCPTNNEVYETIPRNKLIN